MNDVEPPTPTNEPKGPEGLLHQPMPAPNGGGRWAYPWWGKVIASAFILFHATVLIVHNTPSKSLSRGLHTWFNKYFQMNIYMRATGNSQSWAMFAPNPHRSNMFMKVLVEDQDGEVWDLKHDIYGKRTYPYLFYSRMGKINRRIIEQKNYRRHYAAWVCRDWERQNLEPAEEVRFVKMWTRVPPPEKAYRYMGYDPMQLHLHQVEEETFRCASTQHAQLPNYLRERYGMEPVEDSKFRGVRIRTWWDINESKARKAERDQEREARNAPERSKEGPGK